MCGTNGMTIPDAFESRPTSPKLVQGVDDDGRARLRVAHIIHSLQPGGAEALLVDLGVVAPDLGLELLVVSIMRASDSQYTRLLHELGIEVVDLGRRSRWDPRALTLAVKILRRWRPDVIHSHLKHADLVGAGAARWLHVPLVSTLHVIEEGRLGLLGRVKRVAAALARISTAARTIAVSEAQRRWYLKTFLVRPETVITVHNGVAAAPALSETERVSIRTSLGAGPDTVLCLNVGIMRPGKGQKDLLLALTMLPTELPLRVVLVGDGPLRPALEAQAAQAGLLPNRVQFAGFRNDVSALLTAGDLVVSASHSEALPTALLQALAAGRPSVATDVGGVSEVVTRQEARLVRVADPEALAEALSALTFDAAERLRLAAHAKARFKTEFDVTLWARRLLELYLDVVQRHRQAG